MCNTNPKLGTTVCDADFDETGVTHADYPHSPGSLYDCAACEQVCHCDPDDVVTMGDERDMCVHCEESDTFANEDGDMSDDFGPYENHGFESDFDYSTEY